MHTDRADSRYKGGCFDLVSQVYGNRLSFSETLHQTAVNFGLTNTLSEDYKKITSTYTKPDLKPKEL